MKKLINCECYTNKTNKLKRIKIIFDSDEYFVYYFDMNELFSMSQSNWLYYEGVAKGVEKSLNYLKNIVDDESYQIINAAFMCKIGDYL